MEKGVFCSYSCIIMSSPAPSNISQNNAKILENQWQEMQRRHKEEQRLLEQLEEVEKSCQAECMAQKAKREAEKKAWEEVERQRVAEEEDPRLWNPNTRRLLLETRRSNSPPRRLEKSTAEVLQSRWGVLTSVRGVCAPLKMSS